MGSLLYVVLAAAQVAFAFSERPAGKCMEVDFRAELGRPRTQDGTSWCYANSAADLISQAVGSRVSSIDLATTFLLADETKLRKVHSKEVLAYLARHPDFEIHLHDTRREEEAYNPEQILSPDGILDAGGRDDEAILMSNLKGLCLADRIPPGEENLEKYLQAIRDDYVSSKGLGPATPTPTPTGPIGAVENEVAKIMAKAFQKWVDQKCGHRIRPKKALIPHEVAVAESLDEYNKGVATGRIESAAKARALLFREIDRLLDSGKAAAIAYDGFDLYPQDGKPASAYGDHSSVVAARKLIDGRCHYFVRNHFGPTCGYRSEFDGRCEKENGGVWVTTEALKHLYSVTSVR
jgi:hypothetical protein